MGKPGTPEAERRRIDGGVWRYHPVQHRWEIFADGTTNPWGIDWNDYGQAFVCNCVNPHLFHVIQGAYYEPSRNRPTGRFAYERIETIADHLHFTNTKTIRAGIGTPEEDKAGGGHAHCGTMVYLGDNWPAKYRGQVFMNNIHGRRVNMDVLTRKGSGYTASHAPPQPHQLKAAAAAAGGGASSPSGRGRPPPLRVGDSLDGTAESLNSSEGSARDSWRGGVGGFRLSEGR